MEKRIVLQYLSGKHEIGGVVQLADENPILPQFVGQGGKICEFVKINQHYVLYKEILPQP